MNLDQLEALEAVILTGSVCSAAIKLNKTQPSISQSIKKLEDELNVVLFDRTKYRMTLSSQGEVVYKHALNALKSVKNLKRISMEMTSELREPIVKFSIDPLVTFEVLERITDLTLNFSSFTSLVFEEARHLWNSFENTIH